MFGGKGLSLSALIALCRALRHYLGAGLLLDQAFRQQARRGRGALPELAGRVAARLERGSDLYQALRAEGDAFPPMLLSLVQVGEQTGMLPEVFAELEKYYTRQRRLQREFWARSSWPLIQLVLGILALAGLICVLGMLPVNQQKPGKPAYDPLGLGLSGPGGALIFLAVVAGVLLGGWGLWKLASRWLGGRAAVDRFLLGAPALGPCLRALALSRFCLAMRLTHETGMPIGRALQLSLRAAGNRAFETGGEAALSTIGEGDDLTLALTRTGLFPEDFLHIVAVAEESGTLSEVMRHQADHYHEEAERRLNGLTALAGYAVWIVVGLVLIVCIFRLAGTYIDALSGGV
jgi:type IV pilus assembly protein PilC